jgi:hypothetical protein
MPLYLANRDDSIKKDYHELFPDGNYLIWSHETQLFLKGYGLCKRIHPKDDDETVSTEETSQLWVTSGSTCPLFLDMNTHMIKIRRSYGTL